MKEQLTEIKKGQTGTGLLIENDGFMSLDSKENKLIKESIENNGYDLKSLPRPFVVTAILQKYGIENANGRIYPEKILKREVEKYMQNVKDRRGYGEANHPNESCIDVDRIAMNIIDMWWEGRTLLGKLEIPVTEGFRNYGIISCEADMVTHLLLSNLKIGVSSRALGSVTQQVNAMVVGEDLELICFDIVSQNSTPGAIISFDYEGLKPYVEGIESKKTNLSENISDKFSKFNKWLEL